ncbi:MAG: hypothetical protein K2N60_04070 [Oscillospiraceae bacterium]|nr:hypothetical protein [Oscillospiraceae bacterium]
MRKNLVRSVSVHIEDGADLNALADMISDLHADIIERKLKNSGLSPKQQAEVIDRMIENLKAREQNGLIK